MPENQSNSQPWVCILCGGSGKRLWPLSTNAKPKPFLPFWDEKPLIEQTLDRFALFPTAKTLLVGTKDHAEHINDAAVKYGIDEASVILEPAARNTAASVALASVIVKSRDPDGIMIVSPSDHVISDANAHHADLVKGLSQVAEGNIVMLGASPTGPDGGYGHIVPDHSRGTIARVVEFYEKPDLGFALRLLEKGALWNVGIFMFRACDMVAAFEKQQPELMRAVRRGLDEAHLGKTGLEIGADFASALELPFDTAIVEAHKDRIVVPITSDWSDAGTWQSLHKLKRQKNSNVRFGPCEETGMSNALLYSTGPTIHAHDVDGLVVIADGETVYVAPLANASGSKNLPSREPVVNKQAVKNTAASKVNFRSDRILTWLQHAAMPIWINNGRDLDERAFANALTPDGRSASLFRSLSTQARQVIAFSVAAQRGWDDEAQGAVDFGIDVLANWQTANAYWPKLRDQSLVVLDPETRCYDLAQILAACAASVQLNAKAEHLANNVLEALLKARQPSGTGFHANTDFSAPSADANTLLHILNAAQQWHAITGDKRAKQIVEESWYAFFHQFFDERNWRVSELPDPQSKAGPWSPGHQFEWARLWVTNGPDMQPIEDFSIADQLWATTVSFGHTETPQLSALIVDGRGPGANETRAWVQCEKLRTAICLNRPRWEINAIADALFKWHIDPAPQGLWHDHLETKEGKPLSENTPASTLHHIVLAFDGFLKWEAALALEGMDLQAV